MKVNHANDSENFEAFETPVLYEESLPFGPENENRIRASSALEAEE
jgi:hypothetical protein